MANMLNSASRKRSMDEIMREVRRSADDMDADQVRDSRIAQKAQTQARREAGLE